MISGLVGSEMAIDFGSKEVELRLRRGLSTDSPCIIFGIVKNSPGLLGLTKNVHVLFAESLLKINSLNCVENNMLMQGILCVNMMFELYEI